MVQVYRTSLVPQDNPPNFKEYYNSPSDILEQKHLKSRYLTEAIKNVWFATIDDEVKGTPSTYKFNYEQKDAAGNLTVYSIKRECKGGTCPGRQSSLHVEVTNWEWSTWLDEAYRR